MTDLIDSHKNDVCAHYMNINYSANFLSDKDASFCQQLPYPVHKPFNTTEVDVIADYQEKIVKNREAFPKLQREFKSAKKDVLEQDFSEPLVYVPKGVLQFYEEHDYEPPFHCDYNPYYSTGLLQEFSLNGTRYLIRPDLDNKLC